MSRQEDDRRVLSECALFKGGNPDDIDALAGIASTGAWPAGAMIFQRGDAADFLVVLRNGRIRLGLTTAGGRELTLRQAGPGDVVGEMGVLDHGTRSADATAITLAEGLLIRRASLERLIAGKPAIAATVIRYLSLRLRETTYQLESVALYDLAGRLARFLLAGLRQGHGPQLPKTANLNLEMGQGEIAAILGASRPKINRAFIELLNEGAIARGPGGLRCNTVRLSAIVDASET
jgi:CRP/FNR family cyclic AMP-dependent transcriptional regulator